MKTVREVAEELNISRQAVYNKLTVDFKTNFTTTQKINNKDTLVINKNGVHKLKEDIVNLDSQVNSRLDNQIDNRLMDLMNKNIEVLQEQLQIKDQQIIELNERLKEAQELNKNNQILLHRQQEQPKMIEEEKKRFSFKDLFSRNKE